MIGSLIAQLRELVAAGASVASIADVAERTLADTAALSPEFSDPLAVVAGAVVAWEALEAACRSAWVRFPEMHASGAHGAEPDPRAIQLFGTPTHLRNAGCYSGPELAAIAAVDTPPTSWVVREALRLGCLLVAIDVLIVELTDGRIAPPAFADAVSAVVGRFARMTVAAEDLALPPTPWHTSGA